MSAAFRRALVDTLLPGGSYPHGIVLPPASAIGLDEAAMGSAAPALVAAAAGGEDAFLSTNAAGREASVTAASATDPATINLFVAALVTRYYQDPRVIRAFGWPEHPPQPMGHALPPFEEALLEPVRARKPLWRAT